MDYGSISGSLWLFYISWTDSMSLDGLDPVYSWKTYAVIFGSQQLGIVWISGSMEWSGKAKQ